MQVVLSIRDNTLCKEGIFSDVLGEKLRRNKEKSKHLPTQLRPLPFFFRLASSARHIEPGDDLNDSDWFSTK